MCRAAKCAVLAADRDGHSVNDLLQAVGRSGLRLDERDSLHRASGTVCPQHPPLGRSRDGGVCHAAHGTAFSGRFLLFDIIIR